MSPNGSCRGKWPAVFGPRALDSEIQEWRGAAVTGDPVDRIPVDPGLKIYEVGAVAAEFAERVEEMQSGIAGVFGLEREIERLAQILGEKAKRICAMRGRGRVMVLEDLSPASFSRSQN